MHNNKNFVLPFDKLSIFNHSFDIQTDVMNFITKVSFLFSSQGIVVRRHVNKAPKI